MPQSEAVDGQRFQGLQGLERVEATRRALERAVEAWWQHGQIPRRNLLRDGLLILEAGYALDDPERTLLLRAALYYGQGMVTALRHQPDPDRTAAIMADMLLHVARPLSPAQIRYVQQQDTQSRRWFPTLLTLLGEEERSGLEPRSTLAAAARLYLQDPQTEKNKDWTPPARYGSTTPPRPKARADGRSRAASRSVANGLGVVALLLLLVALVFLWQDVQQTNALAGELRTMPAGTYLISDPENRDADRLVELAAFAIDRTEVTNAAYRRCYDAGVCTLPARVTSVNRPDYFLDPTQGGFPMINVTWTQADAFCRWVGKRLPLAEEWEAAAGSALTLQKRYLFPWGDIFDVNLANGGMSATQDTRPVGTYSPAGDSPTGLADMAGNVAEWTATPAAAEEDETAQGGERVARAYVVKGGSFLSQPEEMLVSAWTTLAADEHAPWLGFRCAATLPVEP